METSLSETQSQLPTRYEASPIRTSQLIIYCLVLSSSLGGLGPSGVLVSSIEGYYNIPDIEYNMVFLVSYADFIVSAPIWYVCVSKYGLRITMIWACALAVLGYGIQGLYQFHFAPLIVGGALVDMSRAFILLTGNMFVSRWYGPDKKGVAYAALFVSAGVWGGLMLLTTRLLLGDSDTVFHDWFWVFLVVLGALAIVTLFLAIFVFQEEPDVPPAPQADRSPDTCWINPVWYDDNVLQVVLFIVMYMIVISPTWSIGSLLFEIMNDRGYSNNDQTIGGVVYYVFSIFTPLATGAFIDKHKRYRELAVFMVAATAIVYAVWVAVIDYWWPFICATAVLGFVTGAYSATFTLVISELSYPMSEDQGNMLCYFWGQWSAAGMTVLASFPSTVNIALWLFLGIYVATAIILGAFLGPTTPVRYIRWEEELQYEMREKKEEEEERKRGKRIQNGGRRDTPTNNNTNSAYRTKSHHRRDNNDNDDNAIIIPEPDTDALLSDTSGLLNRH